MTKKKAFLIHLLLSAAVFGALLLIFILLWYPLPFFVADGGWHGLRLVTAVDLTLGPLLTLVVYKTWKPRKKLIFDYTVIGLLQASALGFGLWTVFSQRTVMVAFVDGFFYTVDAQTAAHIGPTARQLIGQADARPALVNVALPSDPQLSQQLRRESLAAKRALYTYDHLLEPFEDPALRIAAQYRVDPAEVRRKSPEESKVLDRHLSKKGEEAANLIFLPVTCRYKNLLVAFRRPPEPPPQSAGRTVAPDEYLWFDVSKVAREQRLRPVDVPRGAVPQVPIAKAREARAT